MRGNLPGRTLDLGVDTPGQHPGHVAGQTTSGDVGDGTDIDGRQQRRHSRGVDDRGSQELVGERVRGAVEGRTIEGATGACEQHPAGERVTVGAQVR